MTEREPTPAELDALHDALSRLRGRRGPGPMGGPGQWGPGGHRGHHGGAHEHGGHAGPPPFAGRGPFGPGGRGGGPARVRLLEALASASEPLTVSELGERIGVDQPRASKLVQHAVEMGLVRREADPDDARRTRIVLTDDGATLARGMRGERHDQLSTALSGFTPDERAELVRLLGKLADNWPR
ncbi:MarR family winged helix-turn-helix transcriptional regulator [Microbacterium sp. bgisy189]|uniref:MarR family winged helix-turn-helix transcriptional regulator n=1 Tax=Microbacterium sp. bgisy189 TaxID=3413798 RepID=UPI003EBC40F3